MKNSWNQVLIAQQGAGPVLSASTSATSLLPGQAKYTMPTGFLDTPGNSLLIKTGGKFSTASAGPGTFTLDVRFGGIVVFTGGASPTLTASITNGTWDAEIELITQTVGSGTAASILGRGKFLSAAVGGVLLLPATSPAVGASFDSTVSFQVDMFGTFSVNSASNSINTTDYTLISLN